jgi:3',5'-cyclic-AMP phosphodiesterase
MWLASFSSFEEMGRAMLVAQISDLHVRPDGCLYEGEIPSNAMAMAAVNHLNSLKPRPELVLITGDIVDGGIAEEYEMSRRILAPLEIPYLVIPGNHDERSAFSRAFADHAYLPGGDGALNYSFDAGPLRFIGLDSTVPGHHHGDIDQTSLTWLEGTLAGESGRPTLIIMHHHPFASGISYLDGYRHFGAAQIAAVISAFPAVERVLCGHVHRLMTARLGNVMAMSCPSTASQIALRLAREAQPASRLEPPGCLLHLWRPGAGLVSHLSPIGDYGPPMNFF